MSDAFSTAVSGLQAASRAVAISASNIVNARSGGTITADGDYQGYRPQAVTQSSVAGGGVVTGSRPVVPAYMPAPGADGGTAYGLPNSSLSTDLVQMRMAQAAYKASAALIRTQDDMQKTTLSVIG